MFNQKGTGFESIQGVLKKQINPHNYFIFNDGFTKIYGIFRGEGPYAIEASNMVCRISAKLCLESPIVITDPQKALEEIVHRIQDILVMET